MKSPSENKRIEEIISFLYTLKINSPRFIEILKTKDLSKLNNFNNALTHSSANQNFNYEELEFFGDAVLRPSEFIENKFIDMSVGKRSELRSQIVSDEWLTSLGKKINIENLIIMSPKTIGDKSSVNTILAETTEALIGALYKCFNSIEEVNIWLDPYWEIDAKLILKAPYRFNAKSALQEWCQEKGFDLPKYNIIEKSNIHGDPDRFTCEIYINGEKKVESSGQSHKKAEKNAAKILVEKIFSTNRTLIF